MRVTLALGLSVLWAGCSTPQVPQSLNMPDLQRSHCGNGVQDGDESDVDCGGAACQPRCTNGLTCAAPADCQSGICLNNHCRATDDAAVVTFDLAPPPDLTGTQPPDLATTPDLALPASCSDHQVDGTESDVDCGGATCLGCASGRTCHQPSDCASGQCSSSKCVLPASCSDNMTNFLESDRDCGGPICDRCVDGRACGADADCQSGLCLDGVCTARFACDDQVKNGMETDVDCGGPACLPCDNNRGCAGPADCKSNYCPAGVCTLRTSCTNHSIDSGETDVDCGGTCPRCGDGLQCGGGDDCQSAVCTNLVCVAAGCGDSARNGTETDVDCGGTCTGCAAGRHCRGAADCSSHICINTICRPTPTCSDLIRNQNETDVDCGGACGPCGTGGRCRAGADCQSQVCTNNRCAAPTCSDGFTNGAETDRDCGGPTCAACTLDQGKHCVLPRDCQQNGCVGGLCVTPSCGDGVADGAETDLDCGGATACARCGGGLMCVASSDCTGDCNQSVTPHVCLAPSCSDGKVNQDETDLNCGGMACMARCAAGQICLLNTDCGPGDCNQAVSPHRCLAASCGDSKVNQDETDLNCGGMTCPARCATGQLCQLDGDCNPGDCNQLMSPHRCAAASCSDTKVNQDETDLNCGGVTCPARCATGQKCQLNGDCGGDCNTGVTPHVCLAPSCSDSKIDQDETDLNCGGMTCAARCATGKICLVNGDCTPGDCDQTVMPHRCLGPSCTDTKTNQDETDLNCGGATCVTRCATGQKCQLNGDCVGDCNASVNPHLCLAPSCSDTKVDQDETDLNCGGATCAARCTTGQKCLVNADCTGDCNSGVNPHLCLAPSCSDGKQNQDETDLNCGGATCAARCTIGQKCLGDADCTGLCNSGVNPHRCVAPTCSDSKQNQDETDKDCGGATCASRCATGKKCVVDSDCTSALCAAGICHTLSFATPVGYSTGSMTGPNAVAVGDLDEDGKLDVVAANSTTSQVKVFHGNGDGTFSGSALPPVDVNDDPRVVALGDVNNDGHLDIVTVNGNSSGITVAYGVGNGTTSFRIDLPFPGGGYGRNLFLTDLNGDGVLDIVALRQASDMEFFTWLYDSSTGALTLPVGPFVASAYGFNIALAGADFNGDGKGDVVVGGGASFCAANGNTVYPGLGNGSFGSPTTIGGPTCSSIGQSAATGDINGDGKLDVVMNNWTTGTRLILGDGAGGFPSWSDASIQGWAMVLVDVNGDGKLDIVTSLSTVNVSLGYGNGTFRGTQQVTGLNVGTQVFGSMKALASGDFNGDGKRDLVTCVDTDDLINVMLNTSL